MLCLADLFWLLTVGYQFTKTVTPDPQASPVLSGTLWNQLSGLHTQSFVLSILISLLKVLFIVLLSVYRSYQRRAEEA